MTNHMQDNSGINSLSGFSYQIRVFVYYLLSLKDGMQAEFETIDDVNLKRIQPDEIDDYEDNFINRIVSDNVNEAIQVKRTTISENTAKKVLLNWILLESSDSIVNRYVLFTDEEYGNKDLMFSESAHELFSSVCESSKGKKAIITKVKQHFGDDFESFQRVFSSIQSKYEFVSIDQLDKKIAEKYAELFRKPAINSVTYYFRIKELLQHITVEVMDSINDKKPYILTYDQFLTVVEGISNRITDRYSQPQYADFKKLHSVDINDHEIANSREYKQLIECDLNDFLLKQHLIYCAYYENLRYSYMESNKINTINNIEETTYENFEYAKHDLKKRGEDSPYRRLDETKNSSNSYANTEQIRFGSGIYLTKDEIESIQISWKDEKNGIDET